MPIQIKKPNVLVVEGRDEELFFEGLLENQDLQDIQIISIGGKTQLRDNLRALTLSSGFTDIISLGIERDADESPTNAFQSVCDALRNVNLPVPKSPLVPEGRDPQVTVMIFPDENNSGALEDICIEAVRSDPAMECIEQYFQCLEERLTLPDNISKAKVQAFLASRPETGKRLGEAAKAGYWPWENKAFEKVKNFLHQIVS